MPNTVDNRAVQMTFDNAAFERNIQATVLSLERLKNSLDMANAKNSFAEINRASAGFNMNGITAAIENVSRGFLGMSTIAITALSNITHRAVNAGVTLAKSLTLAPITSGFAEYETNMNSIQTILANTSSKGSKLTDVSAALDELNHYADQTIYNFSEMARNIGTFTAAGVDLDTSVGAIKGIANLAAISGSNSQQASTAMYQLSQAMASGTVKLMDWNSVVNAGMGGEVFQKALFESGKALGTIAGINGTTTFEEWTAAGNTFRGSLEEGWLTGEVLTNTLAGFTGDLTEAQILAMGYTKEQAAEILKMGQIGKDAATKVKTLTQLLGTIKEAVGSGWSQSFKIIIGDFEEAKTLFTDISNVLGGFVGRSADSRNKLLSDWKAIGGRTALLDGIKNAFVALQLVAKPITNAFRDIFPKQTARTLLRLTLQFKHFTENLKIGVPTAVNLRRIFRGFFAALEIGWNILKGTIGVIKDLWDAIKPDGSLLKTAAGFGEMITSWNETLIAGGKLQDFFDKLSYYIDHPREALEKIKSVLSDFKEKLIAAFNGGDIPGAGVLNGILQKLQDRLDSLRQLGLDVGGAWASLSDFFSGIGGVLESAWVEIRDWFKNLGNKLAENTSEGDYDAALDTINVGLLAGVIGLLTAFFKNGIKLDFSGGLLDGVKESLQGVTDTLGDMQTKLKAEALQKIAIAVGILAAALLVLSLIDSKDLTKALVAMAFGFGQLILAFVALNNISGSAGQKLGLGVLATSLIVLAGAILIMSVALKIMSTMDWQGIAKGLIATVAILGMFVAIAKPLSKDSPHFITAGIGIGIIAVSLNIMALALKLMATMSWEELGKGLAGVAVGLGLMVAAMRLMSDGSDVFKNAAGILVLSIALNILAQAVKSMADLSWKDLGKGLAGIAGGLILMTGAMTLMGNAKDVFKNAAGILILSIALNIMAQAIKSMADMSWEELGKGLAGAAGALILLAGAAYAMNSALAGAFAVVVMAGALKILGDVLKELSGLSWEEIAKGLVAIAGVLVVLGVGALALTPAIGPLLAVAAALLLIGVGMGAFGLGVNLLSRGIIMLLKVGDGLIELFTNILETVLDKLPEIITAFAEGLLGFVQTFLEGLPTIIETFVLVVDALLQAIIDLLPKIVETAIAIIDALLTTIVAKAPDVVAAGFAVLIAFLTGLRDNIGEIATLVAEIITNFLDALSLKVPEIIDSVYNFVLSIITGVIAKLGEVSSFLLQKGKDFLGGLLSGIIEKAISVMTWFQELPGKIVGWIGNVIKRLFLKGKNFISGMYEGILEKMLDVITYVKALPGKILGWLGDTAKTLWDAGVNIVKGLWEGIKSMSGWLWDKIGGFVEDMVDSFIDPLGIFSPSRVFMGFGNNIGEGLIIGIDDMTRPVEKTAGNLARTLVDGFNPDLTPALTETTSSISKTLLALSNQIGQLGEFNPVITPVLDLTGIQKDAKSISGFFDATAITPSLSISPDASFEQARGLSVATQTNGVDAQVVAAPVAELKFEQHNHSPKALSTSDIYRQTRSQFAKAKEELSIP